ncbi:MAG TPA: VCBS repeat-containing protein [Planctomycetota bacterium]|nr:VCBS repeat-containing protein [Planctomycetota bacterium]
MGRAFAFILLCAVGAGGEGAPGELLPPVRIEAGGKPIDTEVGHAAPFVADFDGDGVRDLLVGQFGGGILWIFRNEGTNAAPKLAAGVKFKDGAEDGRVPTG